MPAGGRTAAAGSRGAAAAGPAAPGRGTAVGVEHGSGEYSRGGACAPRNGGASDSSGARGCSRDQAICKAEAKLWVRAIGRRRLDGGEFCRRTGRKAMEQREKRGTAASVGLL